MQDCCPYWKYRGVLHRCQLGNNCSTGTRSQGYSTTECWPGTRVEFAVMFHDVKKSLGQSLQLQVSCKDPQSNMYTGVRTCALLLLLFTDLD